MQAILYNSAALSVLITIVDAGIFKWIPDNDDRRWVPAARTANVAIANIRSPQPTSAPKADVYKLARRSTIGADTCGYISGASGQSIAATSLGASCGMLTKHEASPLICDTGNICIVNSIHSNLGCCPSSSTLCTIPTTCLESTDGTSIDAVDAYTVVW